MKIKISESKMDSIMEDINNNVFYPSAEKVLHIKKFLDKNFSRQILPDINADGKPSYDMSVIMLSNNGVPLKTVRPSELLLIVDDNFNSMIKNKEQRLKFFKQVINDWFFKKIHHNGILSKNIL